MRPRRLVRDDLGVSKTRRLRQLEEQNRRLKSILAGQAPDIRALKDVLAKNGYGARRSERWWWK